jgi:putative hemolysin
MTPVLEPSVTEEEIKVLLEEGTRSGVFAEAEQQLVERVFRYCDRRAKAMMTPRNQIVWIEITDSSEEIRRKVMQSPHSRFPVCDQSLDNLIGVVEAKNLLVSNAFGEPLHIRGLLNLPLFLYEGTRGLRILELFRKSGNPVAIVLDEYGSVVGLLTLNDILQAIVGEFSENAATEQHQDGRERLLDGRLPLDEFQELLDLPEIPRENYDTLAGFVVARLGRIPKVGEHFEWSGFRFEVTRMDGNRVEKVAVLPGYEMS